MPAYKDKNGKWYCKFYYKDYSGERKQKKKSGFDLKKEALAWERDFIENHAAVNNDISFDTLVNKYLVDLKTRVKATTYKRKVIAIKEHIMGCFSCPASEITPIAIKNWQYGLIEKKLAPSTIRYTTELLSTIFNWGVSFCGLTNNPVRVAKHIVPKEKRSYTILTREQYEQLQFSNATYKAVFDTLFFTGMRLGECLALTIADIDLGNKSINIDKNAPQSKVITTPKTQNSVRKVIIPNFLVDELNNYINSKYGSTPSDRLFETNRTSLRNELIRALTEQGLPIVRIHDLRHSHVSMMIELGCNILLVAERIGDTPETALSTYSHLYPDKQEEFVSMIE